LAAAADREAAPADRGRRRPPTTAAPTGSQG